MLWRRTELSVDRQVVLASNFRSLHMLWNSRKVIFAKNKIFTVLRFSFTSYAFYFPLTFLVKVIVEDWGRYWDDWKRTWDDLRDKKPNFFSVEFHSCCFASFSNHLFPILAGEKMRNFWETQVGFVGVWNIRNMLEVMEWSRGMASFVKFFFVFGLKSWDPRWFDNLLFDNPVWGRVL
jgi:hypothetical protein